MHREVIVKSLGEIPVVSTSHHVGQKQVLLSNIETISNITQIARTTLSKGEKVDSHIHPTMDEHFLFLFGHGSFIIGTEKIDCVPGMFVMVPAGCSHAMEADENMEFITVGVSLD